MKEIAFSDVVGETGLFTDGDWVESKDQDVNGEVRLTQLADIGVGIFIDKSSRFLTLETAKRLKCTFLEKDDLLIARMPDPIGRACIFPGSQQPCVTVVDVCVVRPDPKIADVRYLNRIINSEDFHRELDKFVKGSTRQRISRTNLQSVKISLPPIAEQKRIAAILDQADSLRRMRQRAIDRLNSLGQAIFYEMFGDQTVTSVSWPIVKLGDVVRPGDKINYGVVQPGEDFENGVPLVRVGDLFADHIDPEKLKQIDPAIEKNYKRSRLVGDEILIGCVGSIGSVAVAHPGLQGANIARAVARIPVDQTVAIREFVVEQIRSPFVQRYFHAETRTVAQPTLNIGLITSAPIILPPIAEQEKFSQIMATVRAIHKNLINHANIEATLFSSLQHRAFRGEL